MRSAAPDRDFLPAAQAVQATPPVPQARVMLWSIVLLAALALAWAVTGRVDIVAQAPGRVVPTGRTKTVQPLEQAIVTAIHVREGQRVAAGAALIDLDHTAPMADLAQLTKERLTLDLDRRRLSSLLDTSAGGDAAADPFAALTGTAAAPRLPQARQRLAQQLAEYHAALGGIEAARREKRAARRAAAARLEQLAATLPLVTEEADAHRVLTAKGVVPRVRWLAVERERIAVAQELAAQREQREQIGEGLAALDEQRALTVAQSRARWMMELHDTTARLAALDEALAKARHRVALTRLTAPVAGTVQQLVVHTEGGVVTPAQPLMQIVPAGAALEVEARVLNRDIGFVHEGQPAVIKIDTYPFTRYGHLTGTLARLSRDAVPDEQLGPVYLAHVVPDATWLARDGQRYSLEAGMAVTVELTLGQRRVIEFLLSPLIRQARESGRER